MQWWFLHQIRSLPICFKCFSLPLSLLIVSQFCFRLGESVGHDTCMHASLPQGWLSQFLHCHGCLFFSWIARRYAPCLLFPSAGFVTIKRFHYARVGRADNRLSVWSMLSLYVACRLSSHYTILINLNSDKIGPTTPALLISRSRQTQRKHVKQIGDLRLGLRNGVKTCLRNWKFIYIGRLGFPDRGRALCEIKTTQKTTLWAWNSMSAIEFRWDRAHISYNENITFFSLPPKLNANFIQIMELGE